MGHKAPEFARIYTGKALIADPIHQYAHRYRCLVIFLKIGQ